ncbi:MAG: hypothetical protein QOE70_3031 [Chthoniobacter sp.]|jgi:hypothetical protein|nr:hypothetical protein [Chthoniobacter sp.]
MDWIKKHYEQFILALAGLALLACSGLIMLKARSFGGSFAEAQVPVVPSEKVPELDLKETKGASALLEQPAKWQPKEEQRFMFIPSLYTIDKKTGLPKRPGEGNDHSDSLTGKPIPNQFFIKYSLPLFDRTVPKQDPDGDGFTNEDEWRGNREGENPANWSGSTDPNDKDSHPKYHTKLFLKKWIRVRFLLLFQAYDGDPKNPAAMSFQINATGKGKSSEFLKIGDKVKNSNFRLEKFELKKAVNPKTGAEDDVSELTMLNTETNDPVILVLEKETDSPDSYGLFEYQWKGVDIQVKKLQEFILLPEPDKRYKLIDIKEGQAVIQLPDGGKYIVIPDPRKR